MNGQRQRDPLVLLNTSVVMRVQESKPARFVRRVLLKVQPGRVDMSPEDIYAVFERLGPQANEHDGLAHHVRPYFVAWTKLLARGNGVFQAAIASFFCLANSSGGAFALRFVLRNKVDIASSHALQRSKVFIAVRFPCVLALHGNPFSVIRAHYPPLSASALRPGGRLCCENMPPKRCYLIFGFSCTVLPRESPHLPAP